MRQHPLGSSQAELGVPGLRPHGTVPRAPGDAEAAGAPCVDGAHWGCEPPPAPWFRVYRGALSTRGCSIPECGHMEVLRGGTAAAEGLLAAPPGPLCPPQPCGVLVAATQEGFGSGSGHIPWCREEWSRSLV